MVPIYQVLTHPINPLYQHTLSAHLTSPIYHHIHHHQFTSLIHPIYHHYHNQHKRVVWIFVVFVVPPKVPTVPQETIHANLPKLWQLPYLLVNCHLWLPWQRIIWFVLICNTTVNPRVGIFLCANLMYQSISFLHSIPLVTIISYLSSPTHSHPLLLSTLFSYIPLPRILIHTSHPRDLIPIF